VGFALVGRRTDIPSFSWDWFHVDRPDHAIKIQESGELMFDVEQVAGYFEVRRTEFLTDVSVRIATMGKRVPKDEPSWRLNIAQGSYMRWPTVVDGNVV
jgi:hypothetical protein